MITSNQNSKIKQVRALSGRAKERREANAFVAEGVRLVEEAAKANWKFRFVLYDDSLSERGKGQIEILKSAGVDVEEVSVGLMQSISDTESPQGILAVLEFPTTQLPKSTDFILIPDQIRDPGNLGTLLRSAAATGVDAVFISPETTDVFAPKVLRAGMGAHFKLPILSLGWEQIAGQIQNLGVYIADMDGTSCWEMDLRKPIALIIGGEAGGASAAARGIASGRVQIPMMRNVESLNAGVAGSILMFEVLRQRGVSLCRQK